MHKIIFQIKEKSLFFMYAFLMITVDEIGHQLLKNILEQMSC